MTNSTGFYSLSLPPGQYRIEYRIMGMKSANRENSVRNTHMGTEKINVLMLKQIPLGLVEADLLKSILMLPGRREPLGDLSEAIPLELQREKALEPSLYLSDEIEIAPWLSVSAGVRGTLFTSFGPRSEFIYAEGLPRSIESITDTVTYGNKDVVSTYPGLDFRFSSRFMMGPSASLKIGAQRAYQYLHMISNTTSMSPVDIWKLSDTYIRPQRGDQASAGLYFNFDKRAIETSVEGYYKWLTNTLDYKGGAELLMNPALEADIINGDGKAYGVEVMLKKQSGR